MDQPLDDLTLTLSAVVSRGWRVVLLEKHSKKPLAVGGTWSITSDPEEITAHVGRGNGLGLVLGSGVGVSAIDPDEKAGYAELVDALGPLPSWDEGRPDRGGRTFVAYQPGLGSVIRSLDGKRRIGEFKGSNGSLHQVVIPSGVEYSSGDALWQRVWKVDPRTQPLAPLPRAWAEHLKAVPAVQAGLPRVEVGGGWRLSTKDEAALHNLHARREVWTPGNRHFLASALSALLRLKGVEAFQIVGLVRDIAINSRDSETGARLSAARSSIRRVDNGQPVRGASVYRELGLGDLLNTVDAIVEEAEARHLGLTVLGGR